MRFGWRKPYESRGSRTVLRGAGVKLPGLLTFEFKEMQQNPSGYYFDSTTFLTVGNKLLNENRIAEALALFKMSIEYNPDETTYNRIGYSISFYQDQTMTIRHPIF